MFFKLQKAHQVYTHPQDIHGMRVRNVAKNRIEAEITLAFSYDTAAGMFNLYAKRMNKGYEPRYDLLATAKINTVWHLAIKSYKSRRMLSAELTDSKGNQEIVALTYQSTGVVSLETLLPVEDVLDATFSEESERRPERTLKLWHQYGSYHKKVVAVRKIQ